MSPRTPDSTPLNLPRHDHSSPSEGGPIADANVALLGSTAVQTFAGSLIVPGLETQGPTELENLNTNPIQSVIGAFICTLGAEAVTDARAWSMPDASGKPVVSGAIVTRSGKNANDSATILAAPAAGLYLVAWYLEITTAALVGAITLDIIATGAGGSNTQTELSGLSLTSKAARSGLAVVYVASGDVTYATTLTAGSPVYDVRLIPLGRIA